MSGFELEGIGTLVDFVVAQRGPAGFVVPYVQAFIKLKDGPVIYSMLTNVSPTEEGPRIGAQMEMVVDSIRLDGETSVIGWKFQPKDSSNA